MRPRKKLLLWMPDAIDLSTWNVCLRTAGQVLKEWRAQVDMLGEAA